MMRWKKTHLHVLKRVLGVNWSTTNTLIRGKTNRFPLLLEATIKNIRYLKSIHSNSDSLVKQAYDAEQKRLGKSIWSTLQNYTGRIHELCGFLHPYQNPYENIYEISNNMMTRYMKLIFHEDWCSKLDQSEKAITYRQFKHNMKFEPYLAIPNRKIRVSLAKFRTSDHNLRIETGRRKPRIERENRTCMQCPTSIEDEFHFLMTCPTYARTELIELATTLCPQFSNLSPPKQFEYLMTQEDLTLIEKIGHCVLTWTTQRLARNSDLSALP